MTEISDDAFAAAWRILAFARPVGAGDGQTYTTPTLSKGRVMEALKAAAPFIVAAERERCAKIADAWTTDIQRQHGNGGPAAAIRSGE